MRVSRSAEETRAIGEEIGRTLAAGDRVDLVGPLGAGKTVLVQGIARALGLNPSIPVTSPTYARMHTYPARVPLYHWDLYRAAGEDELLLLGFVEEPDGPGVTVVEWADRIRASDARITIKLGYGDNENDRLFDIAIRDGAP